MKRKHTNEKKKRSNDYIYHNHHKWNGVGMEGGLGERENIADGMSDFRRTTDYVSDAVSPSNNNNNVSSTIRGRLCSESW